MLAEESDAVGVCVGICNGDTMCIIKVDADAVVVEGALINGDKCGR